MYNKYCKKCGSYSHGKYFCFSCYNEISKKDNNIFYHYDDDDLDDFDEDNDFLLDDNDYYEYDLYYNGMQEDYDKKANLSYTFISKLKKIMFFWRNFEHEANNKKTKHCILCGSPSGKYKYCKQCYLKIKHTFSAYTSTEKYDNKVYKCKNGIYVRSKSERTISDFLTDHNVKHYYEKPIPIDRYKEHDIHPDFYIPAIITYEGRIIKNIYLEHWGYDKQSNNYDRYLKQNLYKVHFYEKMKLTVVYTTEQDMINPQESIKNKLINIRENEINEWPL